MTEVQKLKKAQIKKEFKVPSKSRKGEFHRVKLLKNGEWECDCIANFYGNECSHIKLVKRKNGKQGKLPLK